MCASSFASPISHRWVRTAARFAARPRQNLVNAFPEINKIHLIQPAVRKEGI
jgi:hypothetical protein